MKNFIKITEVQFKEGKADTSKCYDDYIRPSEIVFMEEIEQCGMKVTKIHFAIGSNRCGVTVKQTPQEIDDLIDEFYKGRKGKPSVAKAKGK